MATYRTSGIIIGRYNFGEADRVLVILTPNRGVIRAVAKGVRRIKSRLAGHLELLSSSDLMLAEGRSMDIVTSARLVRHTNVTASYDTMRQAYLMAEMVNKLGSDGEHPGLFELLEEGLGALGQSDDRMLELWFKLRLLDVLGYRPELSHCLICHQKPTGDYYLNAELGGIVDSGCAGPGLPKITLPQIKFWRLLLDRDIQTAGRVPEASQLADQTMALADGFYDHHFGKRFKSAEVLG